MDKKTQMCRLWRNFNKISKALVEAKGLEVSELARRASLSRASFYYYWSGRMAPGLERVEAIAAALGVEPVTLLSDPDTVDIDSIVSGKEPDPVPPEDLLDDGDRAALEIGRRFMRVEEHDTLLSACEGATASRIRKIAALLTD